MTARLFVLLLAAVAVSAQAADRRALEPGKWETTIETRFEGRHEVPPVKRTVCLSQDEMQKRMNELREHKRPSDCTLTGRSASETADEVRMTTQFTCASKDFSGTTETTIRKDFSESTTRATMRGKSVWMHTVMNRVGPCD